MLFIQRWDESVVLWFSSFNNDTLDFIMKWISWLGNNGLIFIVLGLTMIFWGCINNNKWRQRGLLLLICLGVTALITNIILKPYVARIRPFDLLQLSIIVEPPHDFSFPSGHSSAAFATATALLSFGKKWGIVGFVLAFLMAFSRLYLLVHYPSDILAGAIIGTIFSSLTIIVWQKRFGKT